MKNKIDPKSTGGGHPLVDIIVPVYKVEPYLRRCIDSILGQTFTDFELILVDDGSPDNCGAICDEYAQRDSRVRVIHQENSGVSRARNAGLDAASGTYIAFCDSDDWWERELLERTVEAAKSGSWDWISFRYRRMGDRTLAQEIKHPAGTWCFSGWCDKMDFLFKHFLRCHSGWEIWTRLFKREIIEKKHIRFCETCNNFAEDMGFCIKYLLCADSIIAIEDCLYNYYLRDSSMMFNSKDVIKMHELNEVSYDVALFARMVFPEHVYRETIGIIHYQILYNQYVRLFTSKQYKSFVPEFKKIKRVNWFRKGTLATIRNRKNFEKLFGKYDADRTTNFSYFCLHRSLFLYVLNRRIINFCKLNGMYKT